MHDKVRQQTVEYLKSHAALYQDFVGVSSFKEYLRNMKRSKTWGDEMTLCGASNAFNCIINVITSEKRNWYLQYWPQEKGCTREIFLAYTSPLHYDAIKEQDSTVYD